MVHLEYRPLSSQEIEQEIKTLSGWSITEGKLEAEFKFDSYQEGLVFVSAVGFIADRLNHHPDITIGFKTVGISVSTHATKSLSPFDFELARRVDRLIAGA